MSFLDFIHTDKRRETEDDTPYTYTQVNDPRLQVVPSSSDVLNQPSGERWTTRKLKRQRTYFLNPSQPMGPDRFIEIGMRADGKRVATLVGMQAPTPWALRVNIYRPQPEPFGSQFELGAPLEE